MFDKNKLHKLFANKSRINGLRIWRLFVLGNYINLNT